MNTFFLNQTEISKAVELLKKEELVAFPTETVYGLGACVFSEKAIQAIFLVKGRPQDNPLIAHISNISQAELLATELPETFYRLAEAFFPGPLTLVVKRSERVPLVATAGLETIGIRMPDQPIALALIEAFGEPLVAPSANLSGLPSSTTAMHVMDDFEGAIGAVIDGGPSFFGIESTVVDLVSFERPTLLRPGALAKERIEAVLGCQLADYTSGPKSSPGMKYRHYSPSIPVALFTDQEELSRHLQNAQNPYLITRLEAKDLYAQLRFADENGYTEVVLFTNQDIDEALKNRLEKIVPHALSHQAF